MPAPFVLSSDLVSAYPAKSVTLADYIDTSLAAKTDTAMVQNAQTGSSYSYALADASKLLTMSNASANTVLVTKQATVTWVTGTQLRIMNLGAGVTTLVADTGVTINGNVALKQYQGGQLIRTASDVWLFVPTASSGGMDLITPTSVVGATLSGGQVTFTAATSVSINNCFSTAYDNYLLTYAGTVSADMQFRIRMRASGTDASGSNYNYYQGSGTTTWSGGTATTTSMPIAGHINGGNEAFSAEIYSPSLAVNTLFINNGLDGVRTRLDFYLGNHAVASAYDGMTIFPTAGTMTGIFRVYGLRNS